MGVPSPPAETSLRLRPSIRSKDAAAWAAGERAEGCRGAGCRYASSPSRCELQPKPPRTTTKTALSKTDQDGFDKRAEWLLPQPRSRNAARRDAHKVVDPARGQREGPHRPVRHGEQAGGASRSGNRAPKTPAPPRGKGAQKSTAPKKPERVDAEQSVSAAHHGRVTAGCSSSAGRNASIDLPLDFLAGSHRQTLIQLPRPEEL